MARMEDWRREAHEAVRKEMWALRGFNQIVKVVPSTVPVTSTLGDYITLGKYLINKTPAQIEKNLGLKYGYSIHGAKIYRFTRLPQSSEYEYDLTADFRGVSHIMRQPVVIHSPWEAEVSINGKLDRS